MLFSTIFSFSTYWFDAWAKSVLSMVLWRYVPGVTRSKKYTHISLLNYISGADHDFTPNNHIFLWLFGVKSWFFTWNTPKVFAPPSTRHNFFTCAPPNLKSWIRPCILHVNDDVWTIFLHRLKSNILFCILLFME
jgi:hypothetical protein